MTSEIRITAEDIFHRAADLAMPDRKGFLDRACEGNPQLRHEVEELLSFDQTGATFLEKPALEDAARRLASQLAHTTQPDADKDTLGEREWTLGPYRVLYQIGKGGMGVVYLAIDTRDERQVAVKILAKGSDDDEDRLARFTREGRMLSELKSLKHPNIAEIYEQAEYDGKPCIVLEYVPGDTLADRLRQGPLSINDALQYALQIADALKAAHNHRIVHRDLKPANVKITPEGRIKILDFGIAKRFYDEVHPEHKTRSVSLTESGMLLGTPAYMSPEQWNGQPIDQRADLWALGCLLYEMLTGETPFAGKNRAETMKAILSGTANWNRLPKATPLVVQDLIQRCFEKNASARLADAGEARKMIAKAVSQNRFALSLFLKSQYWRLGRQTKGLIAWSAIMLTLIFTWQLTPLRKWVAAFSGGMFVTENDDLAAVLQKKMGEQANLELVRAALMPDQQADDLLALDDSLHKNQSYPKAIDEIIEEFGRQIADGKNTAWHYSILAQAHLFRFYLSAKAEDREAAVKACQKAQSLNPNSLPVMRALGELFIAIDAPDQALTILEKARQNPRYVEDPKILYNLAKAHLLKQESDKAEIFYTTSISVCERNSPGKCAQYYNERGAFFFSAGNYLKAEEDWRKVVDQDSLNPFGYSNLGSALLYQGCVDQAIEALTKSLSVNETTYGYSNRGMAYFFQGKFPEAIKDFEAVTISNREVAGNRTSDFWGYLGDAYRISGRKENAIEVYRKALELADSHLNLSPDDPEVVSLKAEWIAKLKSMGFRDIEQDPLTMVNETLSAYPTCTECRGAATLVYHFSGKRDSALQAALDAVENGYSPFILTHNPELKELSQEKIFQAIARQVKGKC